MNALNREEALRTIPSTNELLNHPLLQNEILRIGRSAVLAEVRFVLDDIRSLLQSEQGFPDGSSFENPKELESMILSRLTLRFESLNRKGLKRVINGTGIVLQGMDEMTMDLG